MCYSEAFNMCPAHVSFMSVILSSDISSGEHFPFMLTYPRHTMETELPGFRIRLKKNIFSSLFFFLSLFLFSSCGFSQLKPRHIPRILHVLSSSPQLTDFIWTELEQLLIVLPVLSKMCETLVICSKMKHPR